jgi:GDP-L-fucose synthase
VFDDCVEMLRGVDVVLHLAADVGGIGYSDSHPADQYYNCLQMDLNIMEAARRAGVQKLVSVSSACAYPLDATCPLKEDELFQGEPQESNRAYGVAKRMMVAQAEAYHKQYGTDVAVVIAANAYGPGDNFDRETSHVIPALIRKCYENDELVVWGDGTPTRDFFYVDDFAEGVLLAAERLASPEPVNIGTNQETSISDLVDSIVRLTGFQGRVRFDPIMPNGQPRRVLDISRARDRMGYAPSVELDQGLKLTVDWFRANRPVRT